MVESLGSTPGPTPGPTPGRAAVGTTSLSWTGPTGQESAGNSRSRPNCPRTLVRLDGDRPSVSQAAVGVPSSRHEPSPFWVPSLLEHSTNHRVGRILPDSVFVQPAYPSSQKEPSMKDVPHASSRLHPPSCQDSSCQELGRGDVNPPLWRLSAADDQTGTHRLEYWPRGLPSGPRCGVLSSRLRRDLSSHRDWFQALRELDEELSPEVLLVTAQSTTPYPFLMRLAVHRPRRLVAIYSPEKSRSLKSWCRHARTVLLPSHERVFPVLISAPFSLPCSLPATSATTSRGSCRPVAPPLADGLVEQLSDRLVVLRLRKGGRLLAWIADLLQPSQGNPMTLWLAVGPGLVNPTLAEGLVDQGAFWWRSFLARNRPSTDAVAQIVQQRESEFGIPERRGHAPPMELSDPLHSTDRRTLARPE